MKKEYSEEELKFIEERENRIKWYVKLAKSSILRKLAELLFVYFCLIIFLPTISLPLLQNELATDGFAKGLTIIYLLFTMSIFSINILNKHYNMYNPQTNQWYFEGDIVLRLIYSVGFIPLFILITTAYENLFLGINLGLIFFIPTLIMYLRRNNCFNENSLIIDGKKPDLSFLGNYIVTSHYEFFMKLPVAFKKDTCVYGYNPKYFYIGSIICGLITVGIPSYILTEMNISIIGAILCFIWLIIGYYLLYKYLQPDYWTKKLNEKGMKIDIRIKKGFEGFNLMYISCSFLFEIPLILVTLII